LCRRPRRPAGNKATTRGHNSHIFYLPGRRKARMKDEGCEMNKKPFN
jgi:hypothetical protein